MEANSGTSKEGDAANVHGAIETFVRGFCFTRSFTHPYLAKRVGRLWLMRDGPRRNGGYRNEEWVACGVLPQEVDRLARKHAQGRFIVSAILGPEDDEEFFRSDFKRLGYRLTRTEMFMAHRLRAVPRMPSPQGISIQRVLQTELADRITQSARYRQILPEHLKKDAPLRQYVALSGDEPVGWVRSIAAGKAAWCSNMYVPPRYRRRGIAKALLCAMLRDDRAAGAKSAVLLSSHIGAKLYPLVGYRPIGRLFLFVPTRITPAKVQAHLKLLKRPINTT